MVCKYVQHEIFQNSQNVLKCLLYMSPIAKRQEVTPTASESPPSPGLWRGGDLQKKQKELLTASTKGSLSLSANLGCLVPIASSTTFCSFVCSAGWLVMIAMKEWVLLNVVAVPVKEYHRMFLNGSHMINLCGCLEIIDKSPSQVYM